MSEVDETVTTSEVLIPENPDRVGLEAPEEQSEADVSEVSEADDDEEESEDDSEESDE